MRPAVLRPLAEQNLIASTRWTTGEGGLKLGERAFDAAREALLAIERMAGLGPPAIGQRCGLPDLRHWGVKKHPLRWFYFERGSFSDVVRLLGERQDIAAIPTDEPPAV